MGMSMAKATDGKPPGAAAHEPQAAPQAADKKPSAMNLPVENDPSKLSEKTRYGAIPRIGPNGAKPLAVFAQVKALPVNLKDRPRIAIVVSGVGISASGTADAFTLPPSATIAVAPFAVDVARQAE